MKMKKVTTDEFNNLLKIITHENGIKQSPSGRSNLYRPWLKNAYWLALLTGARRSDLANFRWSDILENHYQNEFWIESVNERRTVRYVITPEVQKILDDLGFDEFQGTNNYILAPGRQSKSRLLYSSTSA
ncbi:MAG: hypothetical protein K8R85_07145 [Bacteroidetes bacterium]|nr:hypothetical protein [Bacteroidota bacterium]